MNVMYLCDNNYIDIAGVSIYSLLSNNMDMDSISIFLIADDVTSKNLELLNSMITSFGKNRELIIIPKPNIRDLLGCNVEMHWWIENVFSRIFLEEVFKEYPDITRLLYIDCDTLIDGTLRDLWNIDLEKYVCAGVCEAMGNLHKQAIGLKKNEYYFNAGVFLIDMQKWRERKVDNRAIDFVKKVDGKMEYADESVLNGVLAKEMLRLSPKYNMTSLLFYFTTEEVKRYRKSYINYTEEERQLALKDPRIIHFTSTYLDVRPWVEGCKHPYAKKWIEYKEKTPWNNIELKKDSRSLMKKLARNMALLFPRKIRLELTGMIHAYVKPLKYVIR